MTQADLSLPERRRRTHSIFIWVIVLTLPFYLCGIILLVGFSGQPVAETQEATADGSTTPTVTATPSAQVTATPSFTPGGPTLTALPFTPTQFQPPSATPRSTETPGEPT
ncbi:MAG: hypothetical protein GYB68_00095, partial [Chloroflexi bacterium]|nr:hypothetical protein [Chloroflexota bacterium]